MATIGRNWGDNPRMGTDLDVLCGSLLINVLGLAIPLAMLQIFDRVLPNESLPTLDAIFLVLICIVIADATVKFLRGRIVASRARSGEQVLAERAYDRLLRGDPKHLRELGAEGIRERLLSVHRLGPILQGQTGSIRVDIVFSILYLGIIVALAGALAAVPLVLIGVIGVVAASVRPSHRRAIDIRDTNSTLRTSFLLDLFDGVRTVKLFGGEARVSGHYAALQRDASSAQRTLMGVSELGFLTSAMAGQIATGLSSLVGGYLVIEGKIGLADLAACILLSGRSVQPFLQAFLLDGELNQARLTARRLEDLLEVGNMPRSRPRLSAPTDAIVAEGLRCHSAHPSIVEEASGVTFRAAPGALITVSGLRGDASAFVQTLAGLRRPLGGHLSVDGRIPSITSGEGTASDRLLVARRPTLLHGTIRDNLVVLPGRSADAITTSSLLDLHSELDMLPDGLSYVCDKGRQSAATAGLVKKASLAAALAADVRFLFLDAPYDDLDPTARQLLTEHLLMCRGFTTFVVADAEEALIDRSDLHIALRPGLPAQLSTPIADATLDEADQLWLDVAADQTPPAAAEAS